MGMPQMSRPSQGTSTGRVWDIADEISKQTGRMAKRAEVISCYETEGGNYNTASTQYHHWKSQYARNYGDTHEETRVFEPAHIQVKESGRLLLPSTIREVLGIEEGDILSAEIVDGEIRLLPLDTAVRRAQELVRKYIPEGAMLVDELIADRRREAEREGNE